MSTVEPGTHLELTSVEPLWHFSIEGRLERMGREHMAKEVVIQEEYEALQGLEIRVPRKKTSVNDLLDSSLVPWPRAAAFTMDYLRGMCDLLWGEIVTYEQLVALLPDAQERT